MNLETLATQEKQDLKVFFYSLILLPIIWFLVFHFRSGDLIMGADMLVQYLPRVIDLFNKGGDWNNIVFTNEILGGVLVSEIIGKLYIYRLFALLGLSPLAAVNFAVFFTQALIAYFSIRTVTDALHFLKSKNANLSLLTTTILIVLFAFAPLLAGRYQPGHLNLILGFLIFVTTLSIIMALKAKTISWTFCTLATLSLIHAYASCGHQTKLYSFVFGGPIWISFLLWQPQWSGFKIWFKDNHKTLLFLGLFLIATLFVSLPEFSGVLEYAGSSDSTRSNQNAIYAFNKATLDSWLSSLPLSRNVYPVKEGILTDEYYSLGPLLLILIALFFSPLKTITIGLCVSLLLSVLFSMDALFASNILSFLIPPIKIFRVPGRSMIPAGFGLTIIATLFLVYYSQIKARTWINQLAAAAIAFTVMSFLPSMAREALTWLITLGILILFFKNKEKMQVLAPLALTVITVASLLSFKEWFPNFYTPNKYLNELSDTGKKLAQAQPKLTLPLTRVQLDKVHQTMRSQTGAAMGFSTIAGYWIQSKRMNLLLQELQKGKYEATSIYFLFNSNEPEFHYLQQLYNVCCSIVFNNKQVRIDDLPSTAGPAWFPAQIVHAKDFSQVADLLVKNKAQLHTFLKSNLILNSDDPFVKKHLNEIQSLDQCASGNIKNIELNKNNEPFKLSVQVHSPDKCVLALSINYFERLQASVKTAGGKTLTATTLPTYGPLLGVIIEKGDQTVEITANSYAPIWSYLLRIIGLAIIAAIGYLSIKPSMTMAMQSADEKKPTKKTKPSKPRNKKNKKGSKK